MCAHPWWALLRPQVEAVNKTWQLLSAFPLREHSEQSIANRDSKQDIGVLQEFSGKCAGEPGTSPRDHKDHKEPGGEENELRSLALAHPNLVVLQLDIRDLKSIEAAVQRVKACVKEKGLTLLINNAGILIKFIRLASETAETMARLFHTNTLGALQVSQAFLPLLKAAAQQSHLAGLSCSKAAIANISSDFGSIAKESGWLLSQVVSYRCSKTALNMLTRCQALEYKQFGILCIAIHPGWVKTAMGSCLLPTTVKKSTTGIVEVLSTLTEKETGSFLDWEGNPVPW
ncbi:C-factor-like [Hemicordylus capensis]|uniref:C-factor-like n=1 Tax=Hemicordylus capensis TaxID=884348 RepID=UPI00230481DA|nr:C-factor-like [Hemicordylus capensis]